MAVYTDVPLEELEIALLPYNLGALRGVKGIAEGVENSNFMIETEKGRFILTLYEKRMKQEELPFFLNLMEHLAGHGLNCPQPVRGDDGVVLRNIAGKPAALVTFLEGLSWTRPTAIHCGELGAALAKLHLAGGDFAGKRVNALSLDGWQNLYERAGDAGLESITPGLSKFMANELSFLRASWPKSLPAGVIHADLFPNNVFFLGDKLSGLIDFYFACNDFYAYDVAICINAWCFERDFSFNQTKARALIAAYQSIRALNAEEITALPILARGAAMRFLVTRAYDWLNVPPGALVKPLDPMDYVKRLRQHQQLASAAEYGL